MVVRMMSLILGLLALPLLLTDCAPAEYDPNALHVVIELQCASPVMGVSAAYSLDGDPVGGGSVMNARSSEPLPMNDTVHFEYLPEDFGERDAAGHQLTVDVAVTDRTGEAHAAGSYSYSIGFGDVHTLVLTEADGAYALASLEQE